MPKVPSSDPPESARGAAAAPVEGPIPPGIDAPPATVPELAVPDPTALDADALRAKADELGVTPGEGSGAGGGVVRADLETAVEGVPAPPPIPDPPVGRPPLSWVAESAAGSTPSTQSDEE
jgi:hypothetical protein